MAHCMLTEGSLRAHARKGREGKGVGNGKPSGVARIHRRLSYGRLSELRMGLASSAFRVGDK